MIARNSVFTYKGKAVKVQQAIEQDGGEVTACHPRSYEWEDLVFDPLHYLPLIERKIGNLERAAPPPGRELPEAFATLHSLLLFIFSKYKRK